MCREKSIKEYTTVAKYLFARRQQMEQFARELFRVERTISLVDNGGSGKPKIRREEGTEAKMVRGMVGVLVGRCYQLHYYRNYFSSIFASLNSLVQNRQIQSKSEIRKRRKEIYFSRESRCQTSSKILVIITIFIK